MDPVRAIRTRATYPVADGGRSLPVSVTGWYWFPVFQDANTVTFMTTSLYSPDPREGLDEGSLAQLAQDGGEVEVDVSQPRPRPACRFGRIDVPEDAPALIDGLPAYGS
jgi:hypothetical protein